VIHIRPVSDLRNKYSDVERQVRTGQPVFLTKNGYGSMVVMSLEGYAALAQDTEAALDAADRAAEASLDRLTHDEVFTRVRGRL
jgi:prevent-host-death family protein